MPGFNIPIGSKYKINGQDLDISGISGSTVDITTVNNRLLMDMSYLGLQYKLFPTGATLGNIGSHETLTSQRLRVSTFINYDATTVITGIKFVVGTAGVYTASNINGFQLYSVSGSTYTKVTGGDILGGTIWTTGGLNTVTFTSPLTLPVGEYKLCFMYSSSAQTTAPVIVTLCTVLNVMTSMLSNTDQLQARLDTQTAFPSTLYASGLSAVNSIPAIWIY